MKICFLEGDMSRQGGTERMTSIIANELSRKHDVVVVSLQMKQSIVSFPLEKKIEFFVAPKGNMLLQIRWIREIVKINKIDIVINVDIGMGIYGILATSAMSTKVITWEHSNFYNNWNSKVFPFFRKFAAKYSDALVVLTQRDKENYDTNLKMHSPIYVIHNPVDKKDIHYSSTSRIILSAGQLLPIKGFGRIIEIAKRIFEKETDWKWIICGEGPERKNLQEKIDEAGLSTNVLLVGNVKNMNEQYRKASFFVLTSDMEGLPMVLLEAKSWGIPAVSFDIMTGPSDIIQNGINGYLVEPFNVDMMVEKIRLLMEDTQKRKEFSEHTQQEMEKFDLTYVLTQWEMVLGV